MAVSNNMASDRSCSVCKKTFKKPAHLLRHLPSHMTQKPFACTKCDKTFARADALERHKRSLHPRPRPSPGAIPALAHDTPSTSRTSGRSKSPEENLPQIGDSLARDDAALENAASLVTQSEMSNVGEHQESQSSGLQDLFLPTDTGLLSSSAVEVGNAQINPTVGFNALEATWQINSTDHHYQDQVFPETALNPFGEDYLNLFFTSDGDGQSNVGYSRDILLESTGDGSEAPMSAYEDWDLSEFTNIFAPLGDTVQSRTEHSNTEWGAPHPGENALLVAGDSQPLSTQHRSSGQPLASSASISQETETSRASRDAIVQAFDSPSSPPPLNRPLVSLEDIKGELNISEVPSHQNDVPSLNLLERCLQLYFSEFHHLFPILHKGTFDRRYASPMLMLSMCAIGCTYTLSAVTRQKGVSIYERLTRVISTAWMDPPRNDRVLILQILSSLLCSSFGLLSGNAMYSQRVQDSLPSLMARARQMVSKGKLSSNNIDCTRLSTIDGMLLYTTWRKWGYREMLRRACVCTHVLAAECSLFSDFPAVAPSSFESIHLWPNELFDAVDAESWKALALNLPNSSRSVSIGTTFIGLAKVSAHVQSISALQSTVGPLRQRFMEPNFMYGDMVRLHLDNSADSTPLHDIFPSSPQLTAALWHYTCLRGIIVAQLHRSTPHGPCIASKIRSAPAFLQTPWARLAVLHAGHVLTQCEQLGNMPFLLPRAVFDSAQLVMLWFSTLDARRVPSSYATIQEHCNAPWMLLGNLADQATSTAWTIPINAHQEYPIASYESFVARAGCYIKIAGLTEALTPQADAASLSARVSRLLCRTIPWHIGPALSDLLNDNGVQKTT